MTRIQSAKIREKYHNETALALELGTDDKNCIIKGKDENNNIRLL